MGLIAIAAAPLIGFMHGSWPPYTWVDGTVVRLAAVLAVVGAGASVAWTLTGVRPRLRASLFTVLGLAGMVATIAAATLDAYVLAAVAFGSSGRVSCS